MVHGSVIIDPIAPAFEAIVLTITPVNDMANDSSPVRQSLPKAVLSGLHAKQQIINELISGKRTLVSAANDFQSVHLAASDCLEKATGVPSRSFDHEGACRTVIGWVCLSLSDRPEQAERISERLEVELRDGLNCQSNKAAMAV
jgi:hypothetical protein